MNAGALLIGLLLLALNGFFVAAEFALLSVRRSRVEQLAASGDKRAGHALAAVKELSLMLAAAQLGITMASLGLGAVAEPALEGLLEHLFEGFALSESLRTSLSTTIALTIVVFVHLVIGEMAPKSWTLAHPEPTALALARPFRAFALILRPVIRVLNAITNGLVRALGFTPQDELAGAHSPADLMLLLRESAEQGTLAADQQAMLSRALELSGLDAQAAMVPRTDVVGVSGDAAVAEIEAIASETGRSRLIVYDGDLDRVLGVLHVKDLLSIADADRPRTSAAHLARPALVTPESRALEDLLIDMRERRQHVAIVVDEYGGVSGIVALEDVLEELIGEFDDESDLRGPRLRRTTDGRLLLPGALRPDELADRASVVLPEGEWETVAGFVIATLGRLPAVGDVAVSPGVRIVVTKMEGHRIVEVALTSQTPAPSEGAGEMAGKQP